MPKSHSNDTFGLPDQQLLVLVAQEFKCSECGQVPQPEPRPGGHYGEALCRLAEEARDLAWYVPAVAPDSMVDTGTCTIERT